MDSDEQKSEQVDSKVETTQETNKSFMDRFGKQFNVLLVFILIAVFLVIYGLTLSVYHRKLLSKVMTATITSSAAQNSQPDELTLSLLGSDLANRVTVEKATSPNQTSAEVFYYSPAKHYVYTKTDKTLSYDYRVVPKRGSVMPADDELMNKMITTLTSQGYTAYQETGTAINEYEKEYKILRFEKGSIACSLEVDHKQNINEDKIYVYMHRLCVDRDNLEAEYDNVKPFIQAFEQGSFYNKLETTSAKSQYFLNMFLNPVKQSVTNSYEYISGGYSGFGGGASITFYRKSGGDWKFAFVTQSILRCTDYNTVDMRLALADQQCVGDSNGEFVTVKDYYRL